MLQLFDNNSKQTKLTAEKKWIKHFKEQQVKATTTTTTEEEKKNSLETILSNLDVFPLFPNVLLMCFYVMYLLYSPITPSL